MVELIKFGSEFKILRVNLLLRVYFMLGIELIYFICIKYLI